jgi:hypothetical protein
MLRLTNDVPDQSLSAIPRVEFYVYSPGKSTGPELEHARLYRFNTPESAIT